MEGVVWFKVNSSGHVPTERGNRENTPRASNRNSNTSVQKKYCYSFLDGKCQKSAAECKWHHPSGRALVEARKKRQDYFNHRSTWLRKPHDLGACLFEVECLPRTELDEIVKMIFIWKRSIVCF